MQIRRMALLLLPLVTACVEADDEIASDSVRGGAGKADLVGSCWDDWIDLCGGPGSGNCWCDDQCVESGDCCDDASVVCGLEEPSPVGTGQFCGGIAGIECPQGQVCVPDPDSGCVPELGGADCGGTCQPLFPQCDTLTCQLFCEFGYASGDDGCPLCSCAPPPEPQECAIGGCNNEYCVSASEPAFWTCPAPSVPWAECVELSSCGNHGVLGACGWEPTPEYVACLGQFGL